MLCRYAADAALDVDGVRALADGHLPLRQRGVRVSTDDGRTRVELHLEVEWGVSIPDVGDQVQERVSSYLARMTDIELAAVDVVVDAVAAPETTTR